VDVDTSDGRFGSFRRPQGAAPSASLVAADAEIEDAELDREFRAFNATSAMMPGTSASETRVPSSGSGGGSATGTPLARTPSGGERAPLKGPPTDVSTLRPFLVRPVDLSQGTLRCLIVRKRAMLYGNPLFTLYDETTGRFLSSSRQRGGTTTSNYLISMEAEPDRASDKVVGKLRANWSGSIYTLFDQGMAPQDAITDASLRRELVCVGFDYDKMGPGRMAAALPRVNAAGSATVFRPREEEDSLAAAGAREDATVMYLRNKRPQWDDRLKSHVLDFKGRVTHSSVKNFQMTSDEADDATLLQFGKIGRDEFTMDVTYPLSPLQAFGIVLASLDGKSTDGNHWLGSATAAEPDVMADPKKGNWFRQWSDKMKSSGGGVASGSGT